MERQKMAYSFINVSEGIGSSITTLIKGSFQLGATVIDKALDPSLSVAEIIAVGIALSALVWLVKSGRSVKDNVQAAFG